MSVRWSVSFVLTALPFFHGDAPNESVLLLLDPQGATTAQLAFRYESGNNWCWAIDNIEVGHLPEPSSLILTAVALGGLLAHGHRRRRA